MGQKEVTFINMMIIKGGITIDKTRQIFWRFLKMLERE